MSNNYGIGDLHLGHKNICKFRQGYTTIEQHNDLIVEGITTAVTKRDVLWLLGDCFFTEDSLLYLNEMVAACPNIIWVLGNHDTDNKERVEVVKKVLLDYNLKKIGALFKWKGFWISHAPIHPFELRGCKNMHGHVHSKTLPDPDYINLSVENLVNNTPANMDWIRQSINNNTREWDYSIHQLGEEGNG